MRKYTNEQLESIASIELEKASKYNCFDDYGTLNIDIFAEAYLGLDIEYKDLIDSKKLAMLIIKPIKIIAKICDEEALEKDVLKDEELEIVLVKGKTILINQNKGNNNTEGGLRFSIAHEVAHWILHRNYLKNEIDKDIESEANYLAAALLMPKEKFNLEIEKFKKENRIKEDIDILINKLAERFKVSRIAARIRMESIMKDFKNINSQVCVQGVSKEKEKVKREVAPRVDNKTCLNQQLSYEITEEFLKEAFVYENKINKSFIDLYEKVREIAVINKIDNWKIETLLNIPKGISQLEPYQFISFNKEKNRFYSLEKLSVGNIIQINARFKNQIERFISMNEEAFKESNLEIDKLDFSIEESKKVSLDDIEFNEELINMRIIRDISTGTFEYDDKNFKFLPCYNITSGIEAISEIIEDNKIDNVIRRYSFVIKPNIVEYRNKKYFEPKIILRRFLSSILTEDSLGTQLRSEDNKCRRIDLNRTIFIREENKFITARIVKKKNEDEDDKIKIKKYYKDNFIFKEIKENMNIGIDDINSALFAEKANPNILIAYHTSMKNNVDTKIGVGIHSNDKVLINKHILSNCKNLKLIEPIECTLVSKKNFINISTVAINEGKLSLDKVLVKSKFDEINLYVFRGENSTFKIENYIRRFMEHPSEIKQEKYKEEANVEKINDNKYKLKFYNKEIIFNIIEIIDDKIIGRKTSENESYEDRRNLIINAIGDYKENSIAIVLMEDLRSNPKVDSKNIIRIALNSIGIVNQFIIDDVENENKDEKKKDNIFDNKTRASMLDLLNDIGFVNGYGVIQDKVIYSFWCYKIGKKEEFKKYIPFIMRTDSKDIEFMVLEGPNLYSWIPLHKANKSISDIGSWLNSSGDLDEVLEDEVIDEIIEEINDDSREKIIIISHENNFDYKVIEKKLHKFTNASIVKTDISDTEVIQYHKLKGNTGITSCIYKIDDDYYRSYGKKVKGMEQKATLYKKDNVKKEYKHRNLLDIKILKSNMNNDFLAEIIHRLRLPLTTDIHINMDILSEHLNSFERHLERSIRKNDK